MYLCRYQPIYEMNMSPYRTFLIDESNIIHKCGMKYMDGSISITLWLEHYDHTVTNVHKVKINFFPTYCFTKYICKICVHVKKMQELYLTFALTFNNMSEADFIW